MQARLLSRDDLDHGPLSVLSDSEEKHSSSHICNYTYNGTGKEFRASLHKGTDSSVEVCFISWNTTKISSNSSKEFNCQGDRHKNKVIFSLWNMNANQTDIYFCKIEVMYPPPYVYNEKSNGTVIHVKEPQSAFPLWILATVIGIFALYSLLITAYFPLRYMVFVPSSFLRLCLLYSSLTH
uniref:CD28 molecule n=1 Tax=Malurus cyaneus samueli TaxID=2593467 RepID=A0A8C5TVE9_9PASS